MAAVYPKAMLKLHCPQDSISFVYSGMVTQIPQEFFDFLTELQLRLSGVIKSVGKIDHESWRSFFNERKTEAMEVRCYHFSALGHFVNLYLNRVTISDSLWGKRG
jgi:hypothetical protein